MKNFLNLVLVILFFLAFGWLVMKIWEIVVAAFMLILFVMFSK